LKLLCAARGHRRRHLLGRLLAAAQALAHGAAAFRAAGGIIAGGLVMLMPSVAWEATQGAGVPPAGLKALMLVLLAGTLPGVLSYGAHAYLQREVGAARTALMLYLAPLYGAVLAWGGWARHRAGTTRWGAALTLPAIALATRSPQPPR
jgi:drug/metabolite transporter (DMT)-like permease